jgi:type II secretory pathway pseudopilin PulG
MQARRRPVEDGGETLLELLIAVAIMGTAVVGIMAGIVTSILISGIHRKQASAGAYVRDYAEAVESWVAAGHYDSNVTPDYTPATLRFSVPDASFTPSVVSVQCWNATPTTFGACGSDTGVQEVTLTVAATNGARVSESLTVMIRKP